jgi:hypothetical protein
VPVDLDDGSRALIPHLVYQDKSEYATEDLLGTGQQDGPAVTELIEFLKTELADGPRPTAELMKLAGEAALSTNKATWFKARRQLGIKPHKEGYQGQWLLALPEEPRIKVRRRVKEEA